MDLILWRHADAEEAGPDQADGERRLTALGQTQAQRSAHWLARHLPESATILVSPAQRTLQTVEPLGRGFRVEQAIAPGCSPQALLKAAGWPVAKNPVLVVGHQPTLGLVASLLLSGRLQHWTVGKSNVWWIGGDGGAEDPYGPDSAWLRAMIAPDLLD
jgi:phosphohistidine phosphatase